MSSSTPNSKKQFLRQRRKPSMELPNASDLSFDLPNPSTSLSFKTKESDSEDGLISPTTKAKVEKALWASAKKRMQTRQHSIPPEVSSPRLETLSYNMFRTAQGNEAVEEKLLFREQPRQLLVLASVIAAVSYYSYTHDSDDMVVNVRTGMCTGILLFLMYCFLQTRDGLMVRPHPGVWRIVHGCSVIYLLLLAAISVQNRQGAITSMQFFFPEVGSLKQMTPSNSTLDCQVNQETIYRGVSSIWFLAHMIGWWGKMCMFRDWRFCWVLSIAFEFIELSLQFVIPDFQECWWDSLFMDVLGANLIGMILGRITLYYCETKPYDWSGKKKRKMGVLLKALSQFTPISWSQYDWEVFSSLKRFGQIVFVLLACLIVELNAFFLLVTLNIPKESRFNTYRLILMFMIGIPGAAEYYEFLSNPDCWRLGQNAWMIISIACFEILVWVKFSANGVLFTKPPPSEVAYPILLFILMICIWMVLFFPQQIPKSPSNGRVSTPKEVVKPWRMLDILFWISFTPLLWLTTQWAY